MKDTFERLRAILRKYATRMVVKADKPTNYHIDAGYSEKWKKDVLFGAVRAGKNYVSYYLFPLYVYPDLLNGMPPELKKRMQGKSCFNFRTVEAAQARELSKVTKRCFERFKKEGLIKQAPAYPTCGSLEHSP